MTVSKLEKLDTGEITELREVTVKITTALEKKYKPVCFNLREFWVFINAKKCPTVEQNRGYRIHHQANTFHFIWMCVYSL